MSLLFETSAYEKRLEDDPNFRDCIGEDDPPPKRDKAKIFSDVLEPLTLMMSAKTTLDLSNHLDDLQNNIVRACYELNLQIVNEGFIEPDIDDLHDDLRSELFRVVTNSLNNCVEGQDESTETCEDVSITSEPVIETKTSSCGGLNTYLCKGSTNKYWRYSYRVSGKLKHLHIKGGNERSPLVKARVSTLSAHIEAGWDSAAIVTLIKSW